MLGWFKKLPSPEAHLAYKQGQAAGSAVANAFIEYRERHYFPMRERFLNVLRDRLQLAITADDVPPLVSARSEMAAFMKEIKALPLSMFDEIFAAMAEWRDVAQMLEVQSDLETMTRDWCEGFAHRLLLDGTAVLNDYLAALQHADKTWRLRNPHLASQFPPPPAAD